MKRRLRKRTKPCPKLDSTSVLTCNKQTPSHRVAWCGARLCLSSSACSEPHSATHVTSQLAQARLCSCPLYGLDECHHVRRYNRRGACGGNSPRRVWLQDIHGLSTGEATLLRTITCTRSKEAGKRALRSLQLPHKPQHHTITHSQHHPVAGNQISFSPWALCSSLHTHVWLGVATLGETGVGQIILV